MATQAAQETRAQARSQAAGARRLLNHVEMVYRPGERKLAVRALEVLGFAVRDDGGEFLAACADPAVPDMIDNACYLSEATPQQWAFEQTLSAALQSGELGKTHGAYHELLRREPQRALHFGIHSSTLEDLEATVERVRNIEQVAPELKGRLSVSGVFYPGGPGSLAPNIVQAFFYTDIMASGLLSVGQHFELQWYSDQPPALSAGKPRQSYRAD
jgi:hypothetical protein